MNEDEIKKALADPKSRVMAVELTDELKARLEKICDHIIDELMKNCHGPGEAIMVLHFVTETMKDTYGFTGAFTKTDDEHGKA